MNHLINAMKSIYLLSVLLVYGSSLSAKNLVQDPSFETGLESSAWSSDSTNFGTVICSIETCLNDGGIGAYEGDWWAWFGGVRLKPETGILEQKINLPNDVEQLELSFYLAIPVAWSTGYLSVFIDDEELFRARSNSIYPEYKQVIIDISQFADGNDHFLRFIGHTDGNGWETNFMVDNISIEVPDDDPCNSEPVILSGEISGEYDCQASQIKTEGETIIKAGAKVVLQANSIELASEFKVEKNAELILKGE